MKTKTGGVELSDIDGGNSPAATMPQAGPPLADARHEKAGKKSKRRAARLRSVWISFTGRILAQFVGAAASIVLGMMLLHNYKAPAQGLDKASVAREPITYKGRVARTSEAAGQRRPSIVVLPFDDYSTGVQGDRFAQALTECVTASLAERGSLAVLSRTSASRIGTQHESVPAIARELGVDLVLESSVTRTSGRLRVVAQLIDGRSDEHLWAGRYDREAGDILSLQSEIADQIARGIDAALGDVAPRATTLASRSAGAGPGAEFDARARVALQGEPVARIP